MWPGDATFFLGASAAQLSNRGGGGGTTLCDAAIAGSDSDVASLGTGSEGETAPWWALVA